MISKDLQAYLMNKGFKNIEVGDLVLELDTGKTRRDLVLTAQFECSADKEINWDEVTTAVWRLF